MATNKRSARERRRLTPADAPIVVMPRQTAKEIESRQRIREAIHDAQAITVKSDGSPLNARRKLKRKR